MGQAKRHMEHLEEQERVATQIAIEANVLKECDIHGTVFLIDDADSAYKLGNYKFTNGDLEGIFEKRAELTDTIKQIIDETPFECIPCDSMYND